MLSIFQRFLSFDRLIGPSLVKLVYYVGAAGIVLAAIGALFMALMTLFTGNFGGGFVQLIAVPAVGAVGLLYWRFMWREASLPRKSMRQRLPQSLESAAHRAGTWD